MGLSAPVPTVMGLGGVDALRVPSLLLIVHQCACFHFRILWEPFPSVFLSSMPQILLQEAFPDQPLEHYVLSSVDAKQTYTNADARASRGP